MYLFFNYSNILTRRWVDVDAGKRFEKKLFRTALLIRFGWVAFSYIFYTIMTGKPFEFSTGDAGFYNGLGDRLSHGSLDNIVSLIKEVGISDAGYPYYLSLIKRIIPEDIIVTRIIKALMSAFTCVLIYRLSKRSFGEEVGKMAAIFTMLMPSLVYYTGLHLKETEMVFLIVYFIEQVDELIRINKFSFKHLVVPILLLIGMFFLRTVLGVTALFSFFTALLFSSTRTLSMGKRTILIIWVALAVSYFIGGRIASEVQDTWQKSDTTQQQSMDFRTTRENGNKFSKYAGGAVFAPMIFVIPFPTIINTPSQENMQLINGGNYVKNIMAFFVIFALFMIIKEKKWRNFTLIGSFLIGYLLVLAFSPFAQSERFHMPVLPFELIFAAYGVSLITNKTKKYFTWWMILIFIALIGWSWFKLAGRDMV